MTICWKDSWKYNCWVKGHSFPHLARGHQPPLHRDWATVHSGTVGERACFTQLCPQGLDPTFGPLIISLVKHGPGRIFFIWVFPAQSMLEPIFDSFYFFFYDFVYILLKKIIKQPPCPPIPTPIKTCSCHSMYSQQTHFYVLYWKPIACYFVVCLSAPLKLHVNHFICLGVAFYWVNGHTKIPFLMAGHLRSTFFPF